MDDWFTAAKLNSALASHSHPLPTANVGYPVAQVGGQLSGVEIARPTAHGATIALQCHVATLVRLPKSKLTIYAGDHTPPHFHVLANVGSEALVDLASLLVIDGSVRPAVLKEARAWADQNVALLTTKWKELNP